jgi:hypothetical protein
MNQALRFARHYNQSQIATDGSSQATEFHTPSLLLVQISNTLVDLVGRYIFLHSLERMHQPR